MNKQIIVHTDGASRGNPGPAAIGFIIEGLDEKPIERARRIGQTTNNQAEYAALEAALTQLQEREIDGYEVTILTDSQLMAHQLNGLYRVKNADLRPVFERVNEAIRLLNRQNSLTVSAILREQNQQADRLANLALDGHQLV